MKADTFLLQCFRCHIFISLNFFQLFLENNPMEELKTFHTETTGKK